MADDDKGQLLRQAAERGDAAAVTGLLDGPSPPQMDAKDNYGWTALVVAARQGNRDVVELLLDRQADINAQTVYGETALTCTAAYGHRDVVELLVRRGADTNAQNRMGRTAEDVAKTEEIRALLRVSEVAARGGGGGHGLPGGGDCHISMIGPRLDVAGAARLG
jgi:ankyrin repeat protein